MTSFTEKHLFSLAKIPYYAFSYWIDVRDYDDLWFWAKGVEDFKSAAFLYFVDKVSGMKAYLALYKRFRSLKVDKIVYFKSVNITFIKKLRFFHSCLPIPLGAIWEWGRIKLSLYLLRKHKTLQNCEEKIVLHSDFFNRLDESENEGHKIVK